MSEVGHMREMTGQAPFVRPPKESDVIERRREGQFEPLKPHPVRGPRVADLIKSPPVNRSVGAPEFTHIFMGDLHWGKCIYRFAWKLSRASAAQIIESGNPLSLAWVVRRLARESGIQRGQRFLVTDMALKKVA